MLLTLVGGGLDCLLAGSDRQWYPVMALDLEQGLDRSYSGQFRADPRFQNIVAQLPSMRRSALAKAERRIGLVSPRPESFVIRFKDCSRWSDFGASSRPVRAEQGDVFLVTLSSDQLMLGVMDAEASLTHEFIHNLMRERMGEREYSRLPFWMREGLAVWGAGQQQERAGNLVAEGFLKGLDPLVLLAQAEAELERSDSYLMSALIFDVLQARGGPKLVRRLVSMVIEGQSAQQAIEQLVGSDFQTLLLARDRLAREFLAQAVSESGLYEYRQAQVLSRFAGLDSAIDHLRKLVDERPDAILAAQAWYWIGRWSAELGLWADAAEAFDTVLTRYPRHLGLQADSRFRTALCKLKQGRLLEAERELSLFIAEPAREHRHQRREAIRMLASARQRLEQRSNAQCPSQGVQPGFCGSLGSGSPGNFLIR